MKSNRDLTSPFLQPPAAHFPGGSDCRTSAPARQLEPPPQRHGSPRAFLTVVLLGFALVTLVLLMLSVSGYIPDAQDPADPAPQEPEAGAAADS